MTLLFTACDMGTANYLWPVINQMSCSFSLIAQGNAAIFFNAKNINFHSVPSDNWNELSVFALEYLKKNSVDKIIVGTSWGLTIDKAMTLAARKMNIFTTAIIEHWNLYGERFSLLADGNIKEKLVFLPNQIWVNDKVAKNATMKAGISGKIVEIMGQPFLEHQYQRLLPFINTKKNHDIVFISEQIQNDFIKGSIVDRGYDEYQALKILFETIDFSKYKLIIKLHPQDSDSKYNYLLKNNDNRIKIVRHCEIESLLCKSYKIVGMESMLLVEAALVRDDVISLMPGCNDPNQFIGNAIGITNFANGKHDLASQLRKMQKMQKTESKNHKYPFGNRFIGSTKKILQELALL